MNAAVSALADPVRLAQLHDVLLLEDPPARLLDHLTALAAQVLHAPTCIVALVAEDRETLLSHVGVGEPWASRGELPLQYSFCQHVIATGEPLLIEDTRKDERVRESPSVRELQAIAYAGIPLRSGDGHVLGAFCIIDHVPRGWTGDEIRLLHGFAAVAQAELGVRFTLRGSEHLREQTARGVEAELSDLLRFRVLVENSLAGIYLLDHDRILYANPRIREIFGVAADEPLTDLTIAELVAEEDRPWVRDNVRRGMEGDANGVSYTFRGLRRDGSTVDVEVYGNRVELDGAVALLGTVLDVTDRTRAEAQLRESEERLRLVERATEDVIWEWTVQSGAVRWNEAGARIFRYMPGEVGSTIDWHQQHIHPEDRERVMRRLQTTLSGVGEFWSEEYRFLRGDGQYATVMDRGIVVRNERGDPVRVIGSMVDMTERKREEEAQRFLARASVLLDRSLAHDTVLPGLARLCVPLFGDYCLIDLADAHGELRREATAHVDPAGVDAPFPDEVRPPDHLPDAGVAAAVLRTGVPVFAPQCRDAELEPLGYTQAERAALRGRGTCSLMIVPLILGDQRLGVVTLGMTESTRTYTAVDLMYVQDLAHRMALSLDHARLYREATEAVRARDEVLAVVSHDLRNPLSAIQMSAAMLRDGTQERRAENQRWLDLILKTTGQMNDLIGDLLDVTSLEASRFAVELQESSVPSLVGDAAAVLEPLAAEKGIAFTTEVAADLPPVWIDTGQVLRVISNLVGNAIKFTPEGGSVTLRAMRRQDAVLLSVADTGPGIPAEKLPHVFDRFWQARPGDRRGAGLGLAIARGIVEAHGGRIWAHSDEGGGATFCFTLPGPRPGAQARRSAS